MYMPLKGLWGFLVPCVAALPAHRHGRPVSGQHDGLSQRLAVAADARARGVQPLAHPPGLWSARDAKTRHSMAGPVGHRRHTRAAPLWATMPHASRQHATWSTAHEGV